MKQKEGSLIFIHTIIHRQHGIYSCCSFKEKTKGLFFSEIYPISPDRVLHFPCYHLEHEHLLEFDWNVMADLADLQADLMWYLHLKSEILCKRTKRLKKKTFKTNPHYFMKHGQRLWSKTIQGGEFSTSFLLWITQSISLNIPSYIPLYVIYNHYSITCFASLSEENCAKIITPNECSGTKGSEKIAGHFFFHHTEFHMPKLNTDVLQTFLTYLPFTQKNILHVRPTIYTVP